MNNLVWTTSFVRSIKKYLKIHPEIQKSLDLAFELLVENIHHPYLHTHKLHGKLKGCYASTIEYDLRIIFEIKRNTQTNELEILLLSCGTHNEIY